MRSSDSVAFTFVGRVPECGAWAIPYALQHLIRDARAEFIRFGLSVATLFGSADRDF